jgi:hypothetical protein
MLLIRRQPIHPMPAQNAMHGRTRDHDLVEPFQVIRDLPRPKVVHLPQIQDLTDNSRIGGARRPMRAPRPIAEPRLAVHLEPLLPLVKRLPRQAKVAAGPRHVAGAFARPLEHPQPPG